MWRNPVMFVVEIVTTLTTVLFVRDLIVGNGGLGFSLQINIWLWFTVLFANFAEAVAEGRGKAQAASLRRAKTETMAHRVMPDGRRPSCCAGTALRAGDIVLVAGRRDHPRRRRSDRGRRLGQRSGDHRRIRAGDPRGRRRPLGGHRRHAGDVGL